MDKELLLSASRKGDPVHTVHSSRRISGRTLITLAVLLPCAAASRVAAVDWNVGDVFAAVGGGAYRVYDHAGNFKDAIADGLGGPTTGCAFDADGNLYTTNFRANQVVKYSGASPHQVLSRFTTAGETGVDDANNESVVFDSAGNLFVGHADGQDHTGGTDIHKYTAAGALVAEWSTLVDDRGTDWIDLAVDQRTIFYTSEGRRVLRFDIDTGTQLPTFATLPGSNNAAYAIRLLPPGDGSGGLLVADTASIKRLEANGSVTQTYDAPGENDWFALNLDPNGTAFWSADIDTGNIYRFDIATGAVELGPIHTGAPGMLGGLCVRGEITAAQPTPSPTPRSDVVADSVADFSGVQGQDGWYYGYFLPPDMTFRPMSNFTDDVWTVDSSTYWTSLSASKSHPNGELPSSGKPPGGQVAQWAVRRWVGNVSGPIGISGHIAKTDTGCGNGILARIAVAGTTIFSQAIDYNDSAGVDYTVSSVITAGAPVDFSLSPKDGNERCDSTEFTARIRLLAEPPPTPAPHAVCSGPGTDIGDQLSLCNGATWTKAGSPYRIHTTLQLGDPNCPGGGGTPQTLAIGPGVEICFDNNRVLNVLSGTVYARGTTAEPILFTSSEPARAPGSWQGIRFLDGTIDASFDQNERFANGSILEHAIVEAAGDAAGTGVVALRSAAPYLNDVTVRNCLVGTAALGVDVHGSLRRIDSPKLYSNTGSGSGALVVNSGTTVRVAGAIASGNALYRGINCNGTCMVDDACVGACFVNGVSTGGNSQDGVAMVSAGSSLFSSVVRNNGGRGVYSYGTILQNMVTDNGYGLELWSGAARQNCIARNFGLDGRGRGVRLLGPATFELNTVVGHVGTALYIHNTTNPPVVMNNLEGNETYAVHYDEPTTAGTVDVTGNWFGTADTAVVARRILDCGEDAHLACTKYSPPATAPIAAAPSGGACGRCVASVPDSHWKGEYWNNGTLTGPPHVVRDDGSAFLNFDFGTGSPELNCGIGNDDFATRWTRTVDLSVTGQYRFDMLYDDTMRLYVDDLETPVFQDACFPSCPKSHSEILSLTAGAHTIRVEYVEAVVFAVAKLSWTLLIPTATASSTPSTTVTPSITNTPIATATVVDTPTATATATPSPSRTPSATPSGSATATAIDTSTPITSATPTATLTATATPTPTRSGTATVTATHSGTASATSTPAPFTPADTWTPTGAPSPTATPIGTLAPCSGDCNQDGRVTVDDLIRAVNIALGTAPVAACASIDANADQAVTIAELINAVLHALEGCPMQTVTVAGTLALPAGEDPRSYTVFNSYNAMTPGADGSVQLPVSAAEPTFTFAVSDSGSAVYATLTTDASKPLVLNAQSTAESLLLLNPLLIPAGRPDFLAMAAEVARNDMVRQVATVIGDDYARGIDPFSDPALSDALEAAVVAVLGAQHARTAALQSGAGAIPPGECIAKLPLTICNFDMLTLSAADSVPPNLVVKLAQFGPLSITTNVDWVVRILELDPEKLQGIGTNIIFDPGMLDGAIKGGGQDRRFIVEGEIAAGALGALANPLGFIPDTIGAAIFPPQGLRLNANGVYAIVATSGAFRGDDAELQAVLRSPLTADLWQDALAINIIDFARDSVGLAFGFAAAWTRVDVSGIMEELYALLKASIGRDPSAAGIDILATGLATAEDAFLTRLGPVLHAPVSTVGWNGVRRFLHFGINTATRVLGVWHGGLSVTTRLGNFLFNVSPREAGYVVVGPGLAQATPTGTPASPTPTYPPGWPTGSTFTIHTPQGDVVVNNFLRSGAPIIGYGGVTIRHSDTFDLLYFTDPTPDSGLFLMSISDTPVCSLRLDAERELLSILGIARQDACKLRIRAGTIVSVDPFLAGKELGLSFCPTNNPVCGTAPTPTPATPTPRPTPMARAYRAYVRNIYDDTISAIDLTNDEVLATIPVEPWDQLPSTFVIWGVSVASLPSGIAVTNDGTTVYATNLGTSAGGSVSVVDGTELLSLPSIPLDDNATGVVVDPDDATAYVVGYQNGTLTLIDTVTDTVRRTVPLPRRPFGIAITPDSASLYITYAEAGGLAFVDARSGSMSGGLSVLGGPAVVRNGDVSNAGTSSYLTFLTTNAVARITTGKMRASDVFPLPGRPKDIVIIHGGQTGFITSGSPACQVLEVDLSSGAIRTRIDMPAGCPIGIAALPDGTRVYASSTSTDAVYVIDTSTKAVIDTIPVGNGPSGIAVGIVPAY